MTIIFFGSDPWFSPPVLEALLKAGHDVPMVVTKGKEGNKFINSLVHKFEREKKTLIAEVKTEEDISRFTVHGLRFTNDNRPEAIVVASFGPPFLPNDVLHWPKYGCLNVHASLLPRWRGASPVFATLREGDRETGVSIMKMTEKVDQGPVLGQRKTKIKQPVIPSFRANEVSRETQRSDKKNSIAGARSLDSSATGGLARDDEATLDTRETLTKRLGILGCKLLVETLKKLENEQISETSQPKKSPTPLTRRLTKDSGRINWTKTPIEVERFIRAVTPWPGAVTSAKFETRSSKFETVPLKILKAHLESVRDVREGSRFSRLVPDLVQLPGKNSVSWKQFLAGHPNAILV